MYVFSSQIIVENSSLDGNLAHVRVPSRHKHIGSLLPRTVAHSIFEAMDRSSFSIEAT